MRKGKRKSITVSNHFSASSRVKLRSQPKMQQLLHSRMSYSGKDNSSSEVSTVEEGYDLEFRSCQDDAWYSVRVLLEGDRGDKLRVKYENFPDNVFFAESFKSMDELNEFVARFRKVSAQLQDRECSQVVKGMRVCASDSFSGGEFLFYDAIVDEVVHRKHSFVNGEEECRCSFQLFWLHGPNVGNLADKEVANICIPQSAELDPKLVSFMEIAMQKIGKSLCRSPSVTSNGHACIPVAQSEENGSSFVELKPNISGREKQRKCAQQSFSKMGPSEAIIEGAKVHCGNRQDIDLGGEKKQYILVQNIDKELASSTLLEFIHKQTSIAPQVYIFPSLPWEPYANGLIVLDCKKDLEKLFGFLQNPNHFVVSSKGRPLVAAEKMSMNDRWIQALKSPNILLNRRGGGLSAELKVVCSGTEEFERAKKLSDLFFGFIRHQRGLYGKLGMEETNISKAFSNSQLLQLQDKL